MHGQSRQETRVLFLSWQQLWKTSSSFLCRLLEALGCSALPMHGLSAPCPFLFGQLPAQRSSHQSRALESHKCFVLLTITSSKYPHILLSLLMGALTIDLGGLNSKVQPWNCTLSVCSFWHKGCILSRRLVSSFLLCRKLRVLLFYRYLSGMIKFTSKEWDLTERRPTGIF